MNLDAVKHKSIKPGTLDIPEAYQIKIKWKSKSGMANIWL